MKATARKQRRSTATTKPKRIRCAIYTRKSTSAGLEQEFNSLDAQREACERYVAARAADGWDLLRKRYDDGGFTGANLERPGFQSLLTDVDAGRIDVVVVYKVDRLSRSLLDFARVMDRFSQAGVAFVSVTQNFSTADAMGRLTLNMLMSFAEFEREMIAERTRDKIAAARRRGKWTGGPVPLGYDVVDRRLVVNELEAVVVREAFDLYEQHRSALAVARILNERGRTTKRHRAANGSLRQARAWTRDGVLRVLRNAIYAGWMPYGDELHEGEHDAIIERAQFERIRAVFDARRRGKKTKGRNLEYLLTGLLRCKRCRGALTPASTRKGGREYRYYRCTTRDKKGSKACASRPLPAEELEGFVVERVREVTSDGQLAGEIARQLNQRLAVQRAALATEARDLPALIASLPAEAAALTARRSQDADPSDASPPSRSIDGRLADVEAELGRRRARLAEVRQAMLALDQAEVEARWVVDTLSNFDAVWDAMNRANRRRLVHAVIEVVEIDEPSGTISATLASLQDGTTDIPLAAAQTEVDPHEPATERATNRPRTIPA